MINSSVSRELAPSTIFDRVVRQHLELYCLIIAFVTIAALAILH